MKSIYKSVLNFFIKFKFRNKSVRFLENVTIDRRCSFEGFNSVGRDNKLLNVFLGMGTYTGSEVKLNSVKIGRFCSIGSFIRNTTGRHPTSTFISTHPAFFSVGKAAGFTFSNVQKFKEVEYATGEYLVEIGNDVWIGDNVTILDGIKIGDGAIVGSNSLVTKNIEPYTINYGLPAKKVRYRFKSDEIQFLNSLSWWNKEVSWIRENAHRFENIDNFRNT